MSSSNHEFSDSESDNGFSEDMEALRRACQLTGKSPTDLQLHLSTTTSAAAGASSEAESDGEGDDDLQLVRCIQKRFAAPMDMEDEPLKMKPLCTLPPDWSDSDDCEDDYETLRAIQRRFAAYNDGGLKDNTEDSLHGSSQVGPTLIVSEKETSNNFVERTNAREGFLNCVDTTNEPETKSEGRGDAGGRQPCDLVEWDGSGDDYVARLPLETSHFPKSALAFIDAIKKNRSCQKFIRNKMMQMEAKIEELNKLVERVKILKDFQVACKKRTGKAFSQRKDARVQLISVPKLRANMKLNEKKIHALYKGPQENLQVSNYKEAMATLADTLNKKTWSKEERENLVKGVKQQFQGMLFQRSVDLLSEVDGSCGSGNVDSIIGSINDIDITPEMLRLFLPKVNWEQLAAMYVPGRSGAECQARFLNFEDPLIDHNPWTTVEDKNLLHIVQQKGLSDWIDIAASLGTNRTPFQCLARYQRSLNASILKREWTKEEDNQLRSAVETCGESNWQVVASMMEGRTGTQCSNRWLKTLHPTRKRVGKWTLDEDKRLKVAVTLFGPKTWKKIAGCVPGRTQVQCRERWVNCLDPSLNITEWTEEEDLKLEEAIAEHGYYWSKIAACIPRRTDNQCWRRWKALFPTEVPLLQTARKIQKAALISNFVDRESERPALGPDDFRVPETYRITGSDSVDPSRRKRKGSSEIPSEEVLRLTNGSKPENSPRRSMRNKGKGKCKSSRPIESNGGPSSNSQSLENDDNIQRKSSSKRKRSGSISEFSGATINTCAAIEAHLEDHEHPNPMEERLSIEAYPNLEVVPVGPAHGKKASKLQPRRRSRKPKEIPVSVTREKVKAKKKETCPTNDHLPLSNDSRPLGEASPEINARKISENVNNKDSITCKQKSGARLTSVEFGTSEDVSISNHPKRPRIRDSSSLNEMEAADDTTLREFLQQIKARKKETCPKNDLPWFNNSRPLTEASPEINVGNNENVSDEDSIAHARYLQISGDPVEFGTIDDVSVSNLPKRPRIGYGCRLNEMEAGDDTTLGQFLQQIKATKKAQQQHQCLPKT